MRDRNQPARGEGLMAGIAIGLGWTEGQVYTAAVGILLLAFTVFVGVVPSLRYNNVDSSGLPSLPVSPSATSQSGRVQDPSPGVDAAPVANSPGLFGSSRAASSDTTAESNLANSAVAVSTTAFATFPRKGVASGLQSLRDGTVVAAVEAAEGEPAEVIRFGRDGSVVRRYPLGTSTEIAGTMAVGLDGDRLLVTSSAAAAVVKVDPGSGVVSHVARIPDVLPCVTIVNNDQCEPSTVDHKPAPSGVVIDSAGNIFVTDAGQQSIWRITGDDHTVHQWLRDSSFWSPLHPGGPTGIGFAPNGALVFVVSASGVDGSGGIFEQAIAANGEPGPRRLLATLSPDTGASALVVDTASNIYVAETLLNRVAVFSGDGHPLAELPDEGEAELARPRGLTLQGESLLVTSQPSDGGPAQIISLTRLGQV